MTSRRVTSPAIWAETRGQLMGGDFLAGMDAHVRRPLAGAKETYACKSGISRDPLRIWALRASCVRFLWIWTPPAEGQTDAIDHPLQP
jgi:hypothetical protein